MLAYLGWLTIAASLIGAGCAIIGAFLLKRTLDCAKNCGAGQVAVTVLRPLHGAPAGLEDTLAAAIEQDYCGPIQMVFGVHSDADPAVGVVRRLQQRFPDADLVLVENARLHGANRKVSNLINMMSAAKYDTLVIADADILVPRNWLSIIVATLALPGVGAASCFYAGQGVRLWGRLSAMGISYQFLSQAFFGTRMGMAHPFFGATMAFTREMLDSIGGLLAFRDCLADDYEIGRAVRAQGYILGYAPVLVHHVCADLGFSELWKHELRWARTIRMISPWGHWGNLVSHTAPLALFGTGLLGFSPSALIAMCAALISRAFLKAVMDHICGERAGPIWLLPFRDAVHMLVVLASAWTLDVHWREDRLRVGKGGLVTQVSA